MHLQTWSIHWKQITKRVQASSPLWKRSSKSQAIRSCKHSSVSTPSTQAYRSPGNNECSSRDLKEWPLTASKGWKDITSTARWLRPLPSSPWRANGNVHFNRSRFWKTGWVGSTYSNIVQKALSSKHQAGPSCRPLQRKLDVVFLKMKVNQELKWITGHGTVVTLPFTFTGQLTIVVLTIKVMPHDWIARCRFLAQCAGLLQLAIWWSIQGWPNACFPNAKKTNLCTYAWF